MGDCSLCGQPAGFLRGKHKECKAKHNHGWTKIVSLATNAIAEEFSVETLEPCLREIAQRSYVADSKLRDALITGWEQAATHFLDDGNLNEEEESRLLEFASKFSLSQDELDSKGAYTSMVKGAVLREVLAGTIPERVNVEGHLPFKFQKTEKLIWLFPDVEYLEDRKRRHYEGGHHGVSIRVAKGLYYRVGAFKGHPVETTETVAVGSGPLAITNRHLYFAGGEKSFRIRHDKIVSVQPYEDGVGIQRDAQTARPQVFITGDGWFTYNLLMNVSNV